MNIRKVLLVSKLALVLVLLYVFVTAVIIPQRPGKISVPSSAVGTETIRADKPGNPVDAAIGDYSAIVARNIFGDTGSPFGTNKSSVNNNADSLIPSAEEELGLALVGTISGSPSVSRAIIQDIKTKVVSHFKMGQMVADARVMSIEQDAVILFHNGQRKVLSLRTAGQSSVNRAGAPSTQITNDKITKSNLPVKQTPAVIPTNLGYVEAILGEAVIEPFIAEGQVEGLRITGLEKIKGAKDIGLMDGDIIRTINGHRLTSKQKAYQVFMKARSQRSLSIELLRGNKTKELSFTLE